MSDPIVLSYFKGPEQLHLANVLKCVPDNTWSWLILYVEGGELSATGNFLHNGLTMPMLDEQASNSSHGYSMSWDELVVFANNGLNTYDFYDCLIVAVDSANCIDVEWIRKVFDHRNYNNFPGVEVLIELFDSSYWTVWSCDSAIIRRFQMLHNSWNY